MQKWHWGINAKEVGRKQTNKLIRKGKKGSDFNWGGGKLLRDETSSLELPKLRS